MRGSAQKAEFVLAGQCCSVNHQKVRHAINMKKIIFGTLLLFCFAIPYAMQAQIVVEVPTHHRHHHHHRGHREDHPRFNQ
jgi:hypothetical protein